MVLSITPAGAPVNKLTLQRHLCLGRRTFFFRLICQASVPGRVGRSDGCRGRPGKALHGADKSVTAEETNHGFSG
jgi:hypothetical protein